MVQDFRHQQYDVQIGSPTSGEFRQPSRLAVGIFGCVFQATGSWAETKGEQQIATNCYVTWQWWQPRDLPMKSQKSLFKQNSGNLKWNNQVTTVTVTISLWRDDPSALRVVLWREVRAGTGVHLCFLQTSWRGPTTGGWQIYSVIRLTKNMDKLHQFHKVQLYWYRYSWHTYIYIHIVPGT